MKLNRTEDQATVDLLRCDAIRAALMLKITRAADSLEAGFTSSDITIEFGGLDYTPAQSFDNTAFSQKVDFSTDNLDMSIVTSDLITEADLLAGLWTDCDVEFFVLPDRADTTKTMPLGKFLGWASRIDGSHAWKLELRGYGSRLAQPRIQFSSIGCRNRLGDAICRVNLKPNVWAATTAYTATVSGDQSVGSRVRPTTYNGLHAKCTVAGTSAGAEPTWPLEGQTVVDGSVTWQMYEALTAEATVTQAYDRLRFEADLIGGATDRFRYGQVVWLTGQNATFVEDVRFFQQPGGAFTLVDEMPREIAVGDTFEAIAGCSYRLIEDCKKRFDNVLNLLGEPYLPGTDAISQAPTVR